MKKLSFIICIYNEHMICMFLIVVFFITVDRNKFITNISTNKCFIPSLSNGQNFFYRIKSKWIFKGCKAVALRNSSAPRNKCWVCRWETLTEVMINFQRKLKCFCSKMGIILSTCSNIFNYISIVVNEFLLDLFNVKLLNLKFLDLILENYCLITKKGTIFF